MVTDVVVYLVARLVLVAVLAAAIYGVGQLVVENFPVVVALLFAIVIALPLGIWLFRPLRERAAALGVTTWDTARLIEELARRDAPA